MGTPVNASACVCICGFGCAGEAHGHELQVPHEAARRDQADRRAGQEIGRGARMAMIVLMDG